MAVKALVTVGGVALPEPAPEGYEANTATIVDSARNLQGYVVGSVIRHNVAKITISWNHLTAEQWQNILSLFNPDFGGSFYNSVEFYNQDTASWVVRTMYVSDRNAGMWLRTPEGDIRGWVKPKLSLIEV